jgi:hypothetical protein
MNIREKEDKNQTINNWELEGGIRADKAKRMGRRKRRPILFAMDFLKGRSPFTLYYAIFSLLLLSVFSLLFL